VYILRAHLLDAAAVRLILSMAGPATQVWLVLATTALPGAIGDAITEFVVSADGHLPPWARRNRSNSRSRLCGWTSARFTSSPLKMSCAPRRRSPHRARGRRSLSTTSSGRFGATARRLLSDREFDRIDDELHLGAWPPANRSSGAHAYRWRAFDAPTSAHS
jgi:hypothetical protein